MDKQPTYKYSGLQLPENLNYILGQDFWFLDNISGSTLALLREPMKFTSSTSIFVRRGCCTAEVNLQKYQIKAPCLVTIASSNILQPLEISDDFEGAFTVMSSRMSDDFFQKAGQPHIINEFTKNPIVKIPPAQVQEFEIFYKNLQQIINDQANKFHYQALLYYLLSFFFQTAIKCLDFNQHTTLPANHITHRFLQLAQENFRKERFLDFYASKLQITTKHLSRTLKTSTGYTAGEWLDRLVTLEAKVLLKGSDMTIQQIAEELNFPSQSFFAKYFKNNVGVTPKDFRNS